MDHSPVVTATETSLKPVFIVGVSRSGTTLIRKTLNSSDSFAISNENHFLGHLIASEGARFKFRRFGDLSNDDNARALVNFIYSGEFARSSRFRGISRQWTWIIQRIPQADFLQRLLASDRSERALFTVMMQVYADHYGKPIMGEKTPSHVRYVPTLLEWYPDAKVLHMLRDPRGIFVSELSRRKKEAVTTPYKQLRRVEFLFKLFIVLETTLAWSESISRCREYKRCYPNNYYMLRFEDLVTQPETHIRRLCDYLGGDFQEVMLDQIVVSKGIQAGQAGFDAQAADRWRKLIDPWINRWFLFWFGKAIKEFGYQA